MSISGSKRLAAKPIVYAGGTFDLFHAGHVHFLKQASQYGWVVVGLNSDYFAEKYKRKPVMTYMERRCVLKACRYVHDVIPNTGGSDSKPAILASGARTIVHGDDWVGESLMRQMGITQEWLDERNIRLARVPYSKVVNTTEVIQRCHDLAQ